MLEDGLSYLLAFHTFDAFMLKLEAPPDSPSTPASFSLVDSSLTQPDTFHRPCGLASSSSGFWGVDDGGIAGWSGMGVRYGHGGWQGVPEAAKTAGDGRVFVSGDRIAFLVDREKATASLFRNGTPIPGLVFEDLPRSSDLYIGVTLFHTGSNARIISSMSENAHGG
jgi:hypothetical protein